MNEDILGFVKRKLEEGEEIAPDARARLLAAAREVRCAERRPRLLPWGGRVGLLLAASLAVACCAWLVCGRAAEGREEELTNVIALLRTVDGAPAVDASSLAEALLAWQDSPCAESVN